MPWLPISYYDISDLCQDKMYIYVHVKSEGNVYHGILDDTS